MSKSITSMDNLEWAVQFGCSPSACTSSVKEILNRGISSYIWDEISSKIYPVDDVIEIRKNILLHYLKNQLPISSIQCIKNTKRLKAERKIVASQIESKHTECVKINTSLKTNGLKLAKIQSLKKTVQTKKNALELKCKGTKSDIMDFKEMFLVCQTLLPSSKTDIDETILHESLSVAGAISSRADKREALNQLSENVGSIAISELWNWILNKRICDTEKLINHKSQYVISKPPEKQYGKRLNIGIAKACGQHIICTTSKLMHLKKGDEERTRGINYIEKIEDLLIDNTNEAIRDWLTIAVEVAELEKNQKIMQAEIEIMKSITEEADHLRTRHLQLASEINEINGQMEQCANKIQQALIKFEPAGQSLIIVKNQLMMALNVIATLNSQHDGDWLTNNLNPEIEIFQENLNINALNKILLSEKVGAYRHASTCMSSALITSPIEFTSSSPVYRAPLYHLVYCFENLITNGILKNQKEMDTTEDVKKFSRPMYTSSVQENDTLELLYNINFACERCQKEIKSCDSIYDSWVYQFVNEVMTINENTVHGATYDEWIQRYTTLVYMIHRNK